MKERELKLWTKYRDEIEARNAERWAKTLKRNEELRIEHMAQQEKLYQDSIERTERFSKALGVRLPIPFKYFSLPPYVVFIEERATYEGFLDYLANTTHE